MMKRVLIIGSLVVLAAIGYISLRAKTGLSPQPLPVTGQQAGTQSAEKSITLQPTTTDLERTLRAGGNSYRDPHGIFVFLYPADYVLDEQNSGQYIRISKRGRTQKGQTEMYDGVIMVFEDVALKGQTIDQWVDSRIRESVADGTLHITKPKQSTLVNTYIARTYSTRSLGEATYLVMQKNPSSDSALTITTSVSDPQQVGYQQEVDTIISTIELLK